MVRTDRKLADSGKAMLLRLGHQSISASFALNGVSTSRQPHRSASGAQPKWGEWVVAAGSAASGAQPKWGEWVVAAGSAASGAQPK
jgi:hypothetical protein